VALVLAAPAQAAPSVVIAFYPGGIGPQTERVFERLGERPDLSFGLLGSTQGAYSVRQTLLDMTQGSRLSRSGYEPGSPPSLLLRSSEIAGWKRAVRRAHSAPAKIVPGLLAQRIPGGAGYVGTVEYSNVEAVVAADRSGDVAETELVDAADLAEHALAMSERRRLVVVNLQVGPIADVELDQLQRGRRADQLLLVIRTPPRLRITQLLPMGAAGLGEGKVGLLTSRTTRRTGFVTGIDVLPTVLDHLGLPIPEHVHGRVMTVDTSKDHDVGYVRRLDRRLRVVFPRRFPAMRSLIATLALAGLAGFLLRRRRATMRGCALALLWLPVMALVTAALAPSRTLELAIIGPGTVGLGFLTDRLIPWPRAPAVPALAGIAGYVVDLALGSHLIVRSLLGPNPRFGARFYGIGNELEAILPVLLLVGIAAAVGAAARSLRLAAIFGGAMLVLGAAVGAGRLGADVGGVITIGAGGAAATVMALPGGPSRRAILIACAIPVLAIGALAAIDLATGGDSHFSSTILAADGPGALLDVVQRRTSLAIQAFARGLMPVATLVALAAVVWGIRRRDRILAHVHDRPAWGAALAGGVAAGVIGSLANDSGPVLLVLGTVVLGAIILYIRGRPAL
jgi:hypothetical protein